MRCSRNLRARRERAAKASASGSVIVKVAGVPRRKAHVESGVCTEEPSDSVPTVRDRDAVSEVASTPSSYAKRSSGTVAVWQSNEKSGRDVETEEVENSIKRAICSSVRRRVRWAIQIV